MNKLKYLTNYKILKYNCEQINILKKVYQNAITRSDTPLLYIRQCLLNAQLFDETVSIAPLVHEVNHVADVHADATCQTLVKPDVA